jgi:hypothetical protein
MRPAAVRIAHDVRAIASGGSVRLLNQPIALGCDAIADAPWTAPAKVDDRTVDYLLSVRRGFEALGDAARGLAALLILEASGALAARPPGALPRPQRPRGGGGRDPSWPADAAGRSSATSSRGLGRSAGRGGGRHVEGPAHHTRRTLALVREAQDHLRYAERVLPGFEIVALGESCAPLRGSEELSAADGDLFDLGAGIRLRPWRGGRSDRLRRLPQAACRLPLRSYAAAGSRRCGHG